MLPRTNRLKSIKLHSPGILREKNLLIRFRMKSTGDNRFAFVVSKRIFNSAVKRNELRRHLSECVRDLLVRINKPVDAILIIG